MKKIFLTAALMTCFSSFVFAQSSKCFRSEWLQQSHTIMIDIAGAKVSGTFFVTHYDEDRKGEYNFTGTKAGNSMTIKFAGGKLPDIAPSEIRGNVWTLAKKAGAEVLRFKVYGKNYDTNKYELTTTEYTTCPALDPGSEESESDATSYLHLPALARKVVFAKGASSATMRISFTKEAEQRVFSIAARKGQVLSIEAPGCAIRVLLPNLKPYSFDENPGSPDSGKASNALDMLTIDPLPQAGKYLVVLANAGGDPARKRDVKIAIK